MLFLANLWLDILVDHFTGERIYKQTVLLCLEHLEEGQPTGKHRERDNMVKTRQKDEL